MAKRNSLRTRQLIAEEAARIVVDEGVGDYHAARLKACSRLGLGTVRDQPSPQEIEQALLERQRLFAPPGQRAALRALREVAVEVMRFLADFDPRLVGGVLKGTANHLSHVQLHVFSDRVESVAVHLIDHNIRYQAIDRRQHGLALAGVPGFAFAWRNTPVEVLVFPDSGLRVPPPSPVDGKRMQRADLRQVERLLEALEIAG